MWHELERKPTSTPEHEELYAVVVDMLAAARAEGARDMRTKIEELLSRMENCQQCGKPHLWRELHHPGEPHMMGSEQEYHAGPCATWADESDGHPYMRPLPIEPDDLRALLADGGEPQ